MPRLRYEIASRPEVISSSYFLLDRFAELADTVEAELTLVLIHPRDTIEGGIVERWSRSGEPGRQVRAYCEKKGLKVIDLLDFMRGREARRKYFYAKDGHFNPAGHEFVAEVIYREVIRDRPAVH